MDTYSSDDQNEHDSQGRGTKGLDGERGEWDEVRVGGVEGDGNGGCGEGEGAGEEHGEGDGESGGGGDGEGGDEGGGGGGWWGRG